MLFHKKKRILTKDNIITDCPVTTSDDAILQMGNLLKNSGYITDGYIQGMLERDHNLSVYIGNDIAIPHGEIEYFDSILYTGIGVMIYPEGLDWHGNKARVVIGIAAKGDEHMPILSHIAETLYDMEIVEKIVHGSVDEIYDILKI
ncbi:PTS sugar transporter subunit IIA [Catenisphaera adipataccumulans]|jgi:mannitol/fructose-specific phosphotransferase system IIA component|uniref:Mannitol-specific phosphotransferase enzyme IIA component n=1 Tax=Catenisphaera adipataccumulans TaxID=700500 RepID=A0A7W8FXI9_9FIRM|nr:PTS sugar transporter subunit IIA [Catenisphaera adipataccumulans]MBB5183790.1 mannitol/fructose-specific phosphotransferase system IIA component [Catenisphaera adipataccumulans]